MKPEFLLQKWSVFIPIESTADLVDHLEVTA